MINVCLAIDCPYFRSKTNGVGCQLYVAALHCHLIYPGNDIHKDGFGASTQYALFQESPDVDALKLENETYLRTDRQYLQSVELIQSNRLSIQYPSRIL